MGPAADTTLSDLLYRDIADGRLAVGQVISETELGRRYGVSRTPVREALAALEDSRILERRKGGVVITEPSPQEILDIYDVRIALEAESCRLAALRRSELDLRLLTAVCELMRSERRTARLAELSSKFHGALRQASHNDVLIGFLERLDLSLARFRHTTLAEPGRAAIATRQHLELLTAIAGRDAERAEATGRQHLTEAREIRLKQYGDEFSARDDTAPGSGSQQSPSRHERVPGC